MSWCTIYLEFVMSNFDNFSSVLVLIYEKLYEQIYVLEKRLIICSKVSSCSILHTDILDLALSLNMILDKWHEIYSF